MPISTIALAKLGKLKDQSLRPWTLDFEFDESINAECSELDKTLRRTAPFKKGGDYGYLKGNHDNNCQNDVMNGGKMNGIKKRSSVPSKSRRATNYTTNSNAESDEENYGRISDRIGESEGGTTSKKNVISKGIRSLKPKGSVSHSHSTYNTGNNGHTDSNSYNCINSAGNNGNNGDNGNNCYGKNGNNNVPQSEPNVRKPLIINAMNTPLHDYSNLSQLQVR